MGKTLVARCRSAALALVSQAAGALSPGFVFVLLLAAMPLLHGAAEPIAGSLSPFIRWFLVGMITLVIAISINTSPLVGLVLMLLYISLMGAIRRGLIPFLGYESTDPITIVGAVIGVGMALRFIQRGQIRRDTLISKLLVPLMIVMLVEVFNPLQGGLLVGMSGAIFYLGPVSWYLIGRNLGNRKILMVLCNVIILIAICAGIYGLMQTYNGFLPEEIAWIRQSGYRQLMSSGRYRVFSFYLSFGEYVFYLSMGAILSWVQVIRRRYIYIAPLALLLLVLFLSSSRGGVVMTLLGVGVVWAVQGKNWRGWLPRLVIAAVLGAYGLSLGLQEARQISFSKETSGYAEHQIEGLTDPFGKKSTGGAHAELLGGGIMAGVRNPIGRGLGVTTNAARKFGDGTNVSTELDVSDMFVTCGLVGGLLYVGLVGAICLTVGRYWHGTRDHVGLSIIGLLSVTAGNWLTGSYYSLTVTVWICLGVLDHLVSHWMASLPAPPPRGPARQRTTRRTQAAPETETALG